MKIEDLNKSGRPRREGDAFLFLMLVLVVIGGVSVAAVSAFLGAL